MKPAVSPKRHDRYSTNRSQAARLGQAPKATMRQLRYLDALGKELGLEVPKGLTLTGASKLIDEWIGYRAIKRHNEKGTEHGTEKRMGR